MDGGGPKPRLFVAFRGARTRANAIINRVRSIGGAPPPLAKPRPPIAQFFGRTIQQSRIVLPQFRAGVHIKIPPPPPKPPMVVVVCFFLRSSGTQLRHILIGHFFEVADPGFDPFVCEPGRSRKTGGARCALCFNTTSTNRNLATRTGARAQLRK